MFTGLMATYALLTPPALAFCGVYVGSAEDAPTNARSRVVMTRSEVWDSELGDTEATTTLTLAADVQTVLSEFALVVPVPEGLGEDDVTTIDAEVVDKVFAFADPRAVAYSCESEVLREEQIGAETPDIAFGCNEYELLEEDKFYGYDEGVAAGVESEATGVEVEATFTEAEYEIFVLSAEEGDGLREWLRAEGFATAPQTEAVLDELIEEGSWFLAARVVLDAVPEDRTWLSPIQLRYASEHMVLPIRIGTAAAEDTQEVQLIVLDNGGSAAISNYPEATVESECMWPEGEDFSEYFDAAVAAAVDEQGGAAWFTEYAWPLSQKCDPCTTPSPFDGEEMAALGVHDGWDLWLTRLRVRYEPELAREDLVLYNSGLTEASQLRYITPTHELEYLFPTCGQGFAETPGECPDPGAPAVGCSVSARPVFTGLAFALSLLWRRRERT